MPIDVYGKPLTGAGALEGAPAGVGSMPSGFFKSAPGPRWPGDPMPQVKAVPVDDATLLDALKEELARDGGAEMPGAKLPRKKVARGREKRGGTADEGDRGGGVLDVRLPVQLGVEQRPAEVSGAGSDDESGVQEARSEGSPVPAGELTLKERRQIQMAHARAVMKAKREAAKASHPLYRITSDELGQVIEKVAETPVAISMPWFESSDLEAASAEYNRLHDLTVSVGKLIERRRQAAQGNRCSFCKQEFTQGTPHYGHFPYQDPPGTAIWHRLMTCRNPACVRAYELAVNELGQRLKLGVKA